MPVVEAEGTSAQLIVGSLYGERSPVKTYSDMFYADVLMVKGAKFPVSSEHTERAVFVVDGDIGFHRNDGTFHAGQLVVLKPKSDLAISCVSTAARLMLFGGEPFSEKRHIWWNFVSSSKERIEEAKKDWKEMRFAPVPEEAEFIPLPADSRPVVVRYP